MEAQRQNRLPMVQRLGWEERTVLFSGGGDTFGLPGRDVRDLRGLPRANHILLGELPALSPASLNSWHYAAVLCISSRSHPLRLRFTTPALLLGQPEPLLLTARQLTPRAVLVSGTSVKPY